jgi:hypothetical protein
MSAENQSSPKRTYTARSISALMMMGILVFIVPGTDDALGFKPGTLSLILMSLAGVIALFSFIMGPRQPSKE